MTQDEIIEMARQAGLPEAWISNTGVLKWADLGAFAKLVEDKVTARYMQLFLDPENQPTQFGTATQEYREQEIKDEREACSELRKTMWCPERNFKAAVDSALDFYAERIRARGEA